MGGRVMLGRCVEFEANHTRAGCAGTVVRVFSSFRA